MMETIVPITHKGKNYDPIASRTFGLDDLVMINGIVGDVDYISQESIILIDENEEPHEIAIQDIRLFAKYATFIKGNLSNITI